MPKAAKLHDPMEAFRNACQNPNLTIAQAMAFHPEADHMRSQPQQKVNYEELFYTILTEAGWHFDEATIEWKCMDTFISLRLIQYYKKQGRLDAFVLCLKKVYDDQIKERGYPLDRHQKQAILCFMQRNFLR